MNGCSGMCDAYSATCPCGWRQEAAVSGVIVEDFAGPGGWDEGARLIGVGGIVGYEHDEAACATAEAAGHRRVRGDVQDVQRGSGTPPWGYIASPPCQAWSTAGKRQGILDQPAIFAHLDAVIAAGEWVDYPRDGWHDDRSPLVLEVVRAVLQLRPTWIALEQVPGVLPFWERLAAFLRSLGYRAWCGILDAEMYGVPQTRDRAILTASLDPAHNVSRPPATHERYRFGETEAPADLFGELLPCVSMAQALGWGMTERPSITVTAGGGRQGGPDPLDGGSGARATLKREQAAGRYAWRRNRSDAFLADNPRRDHPGDEPAPVIDSKARSATWVVRTGNNSMVTGRTGSHAGDGDVQPYERSIDAPAPTLDTNVGSKWRVGDWIMNAAGMTGLAPRDFDEPSATITGKGTAALTDGVETVRVTVDEAAVLQTFRVGYPWQGSRTKQFEQVGNAIPPLLSCAVLGHTLNVAGWQDVCRGRFAERAA